jgi:hypothetical protein
VGIGTSSPAAMAGKSLQISDRSAFFQLTINNATYFVNNLYYDGTNWRYIVTAGAALITLDTTGTIAFYRAASGTAGAVAGLINTFGSDTASNFQFNSGYGSLAIAYGCRAWVNFNGTGTVAIRASGNVSSITDNGVGDYTVNFTTSMPDVNYSTTVTAGQKAVVWGIVIFANSGAFATSGVRFITQSPNDAANDTAFVCVAIHR